MRRFLSYSLALLLAGSAFAQDEPYFPKLSYFKHHFGVTQTRVELAPPVRLKDYVVDGKLELSLRSYLDLVMANNPDITIQKLTVETYRNAVTRSLGIFDPIGTASFSTTRSLSPQSNATSGATTLNELDQPFALGYQQLTPTGLTYNLSFNELKVSSNSVFATYNPSMSANLNMSITQPLLRNRGAYITRLPIIIASSRLRSSHYTLEDQIIQLISNAELAYWAVVEARETLRVQEESLTLADAALKRTKREIELGATSALDVYQPEGNYATAQFNVTQARYNLQQAADALRRQIGADVDPATRNLPLDLTESIAPPTDTTSFDPEAEVAKAIAQRPDLHAIEETEHVDDLSIKLADNGLRPELDLTAQYGSAGQGGTYFQKQDVFLNDGSSSTVTNILPGGVGDALYQLFGFGAPTYGFGLTLRLPIRDHAASANLADAVVAKHLDALRAKSAMENIRLQVLQAISQVESSKASVHLAKMARDLAQKRLDADQKRYDLGTTTMYFVLDSQNNLANADLTLVRESINYRRNLMNLLERTGELLDARGITVQ
jgi:outer membrane protein